MLRTLSCAAAAALALVAAGCAGSSDSGSVPPAPDGGSAARQVRAASLPSRLLFVPTETGTIAIYPLVHPNHNGPLATISGLTGSQQQMVVDAAGNLFVVNNGASASDDFVSKFAPPYDGAPTILNTQWEGALFYPIGIAVDAQGTAYVTSCGAYCLETGAVYVYPAGATNPSNQITSPLFNSLAGIVSDAAGNLLVAGWDLNTGGVDVYSIAAGSSSAHPLHLHGLSTGNGGNGVALDASGDLYVGANSNSDYILEFKPGKRTAFRAIRSMPFGQAPTSLDVGPDGNLYSGIGCPFGPCPEVDGFRPDRNRAFVRVGTSQSSTFVAGVATAPNLLLEEKP